MAANNFNFVAVCSSNSNNLYLSCQLFVWKSVQMLCNETDSSYKNLGRYLWRDGSSLRGSGHNIEDNVSDGLLVGLMVILFGFGRI